MGSSAGSLLVGETATYRVTFAVTQQAIDAGGFSNTATASGTAPNSVVVSDVSDNGNDGDGNTVDDPTTVTIPANPGMTLDKSSPTSSFAVAGQNISYIYQVTNSGNVTLTDAIAVSPLLGLKLNGTLNEESEQLDMVGVMSPAYALTGALNELPLLGELLGGEGEGILAMTFTLQGQMRDPSFSVNPLSILTPGFLRRVFTSRGGAQRRSGDQQVPVEADR